MGGRLTVHVAADYRPGASGTLPSDASWTTGGGWPLQALRVKDLRGRLPLHVLIDAFVPDLWTFEDEEDTDLNFISDLNLIRGMAERHPHMLRLRDGRGRRPLHCTIAPASSVPIWDRALSLFEKRRDF